MSDDGDPYLREAQHQIDRLIQARARQFAMGLLGLDLLYAAVHRSWMGLPTHPMAVIPMGLSFLALLTMAIWLRRPRPLAEVNGLGGIATLLAILGTLLHLQGEASLWETTHLMLVAVGAGCFIFSLPWLVLNLTVALGGWIAYALTARPAGWPYFGVDLLASVLLGLILHFVRWEQLSMVRDLLVRDQRHAAEQHHLLEELRKALEGIKTLRGLIPICSSCKKVRDDRGYWHQVEAYVHAHSEATFTHGLCPRCADVLRAEFETIARDSGSPP